MIPIDHPIVLAWILGGSTTIQDCGLVAPFSFRFQLVTSIILFPAVNIFSPEFSVQPPKTQKSQALQLQTLGFYFSTPMIPLFSVGDS
jgi:hypothetical protein